MNETSYELLKFYKDRVESMSLKISEQETLINELLQQVAFLKSQSRH